MVGLLSRLIGHVRRPASPESDLVREALERAMQRV